MTEPDRVESAGIDRDQLREKYRTAMLDSFGGWSGSIITAIPPAVFVIVNATSSLRPAIYTAVGSGVVLTLYRLARKQPIQQAITGLFGVLIAAFIASRTGEARGYFLLGIWTSFAYAAAFAVTLVVRRPLVGLLWEFVDPSQHTKSADSATDEAFEDESFAVTRADEPLRSHEPAVAPQPWHKVRPLLTGYMWATLVGVALFVSRGIVQATLYENDATGWLAFARIAMGYPLFIVALGAAYWLGRRGRVLAELAR